MNLEHVWLLHNFRKTQPKIFWIPKRDLTLFAFDEKQFLKKEVGRHICTYNHFIKKKWWVEWATCILNLQLKFNNFIVASVKSYNTFFFFFFFSFKFYSVQSSANKYKMIIIHLCTITKSQIITFLHLSRNNMNAFFRIAI